MKKNGILVVISGFSGAGKGTLVRKLMEKYDNYSLSVSMTTRDKRDGEEDGVHYFFVDHRKFEQTIANGTYYLYSPYTGLFLGSGANYGTSAFADKYGVPFDLELHADGYMLKFVDWNKYLYGPNWLYVDGDNGAKFKIAESTRRLHGICALQQGRDIEQSPLCLP